MTAFEMSLTDGIKPIRFPKYKCEKHGESDTAVHFVSHDGAAERYCMECYQEMVAANCCKVEQV